VTNKVTNFRGPVRVGQQNGTMNAVLSAGNLDVQRGDVILCKQFPFSADWRVAFGGTATSAVNAAVGRSKDLKIGPCIVTNAYMRLTSAWVLSAAHITDFMLGTSATPAAYSDKAFTGPVTAGQMNFYGLADTVDNHAGNDVDAVLTADAQFVVTVSCRVVPGATSPTNTVPEGRFFVEYIQVLDE